MSVLRAFSVRGVGLLLGMTVLALSMTPAASAESSPPVSPSPEADAALPHVSYDTGGLSATVSGSLVTATVTLKASRTVTAEKAGICVQNAAGVSHDFVKSSTAYFGKIGRTFVRSKSFIPGTYTYWGCAQVDGGWYDMGEKKTFSVAAAAEGRSTASGVEMPDGAPAGWTRVFSQDFATDQDKGRFPGVDGAKWKSHHGVPDTSKRGDYDQGIISVHHGALDVNLGIGADGRP
jgi:hypothetical protein